MKYKLLKILDICGLTFLTPLVRLWNREEPRVQLKKIVQLIIVPVLSVWAFLVLWTEIAPRHRTKSGEVPTPAVVWNATKDIWTFHRRENLKEQAFQLTGEQRAGWLAAAEARLQQLPALETAAIEVLGRAEAAGAVRLKSVIDPLTSQIAAVQKQADQEAADRMAEIDRLGSELTAGDAARHESLLGLIRQHQLASDASAAAIQELRTEEIRLRSIADPATVAARRQRTELAEERQFLEQFSEQLGRGNRDIRLADVSQTAEAELASFQVATGADAVRLGAQIVKSEERLKSAAESRYAKPWTLPDQIKRSLACVFFGFLLSAAIAIPAGILCGLSPTFMAAMTPFIAVLKPVSPIVWLPIALIIVGGFIPDPARHWLIELLAGMPLIGRLQINPAFIASGVTVALCSMWPTLVNTALGVASIDKDHLNVARVLRLDFRTRLMKIVIPSALPLIFAGMRISLGVGWMVLIAAELLSSSEGLGKFIWDQFNNGAADSFAKMVAVVFIVGALGFLLDRIMIVLQRLVSFDGAAATL